MAKKKLLILDIKKNYDKKFEDYDVAYLSDGEANLKNCHIINFNNKNLKNLKKILIEKINLFTNLGYKFSNQTNYQDYLEINNFRNDKYNEYYKTLKILYLKNKVKKYKNIEVITDDKKFFQVYRSFTKKSKIYLLNEEKKIKKYYFILTNLYFLLKIILIKSLLIFSKNENLKNKEIFLSIYPLLFKKSKNILYNKNKINYLNFILSDESHIQENIFHIFARVIKIKNEANFYHIEKYIELRDLFSFLIDIFLYKKIFSKIKYKKISIKNIDFTNVYKDIFEISYIKFFKTKIYLNALKKFIKNNNINKLHYYLFEYSYGKQIHEYVKKKDNNLKSIAYQHGIYSSNFIWVDKSKKLLAPDEIVLKSKMLKNVYKKIYGSKTKYHIRNFGSLDNFIKYKKKLSKNKINKYKYLVFLGLHDSNEMITKIKNIKNKKLLFYIKPHPKRNIPNNKISDNIRILNTIPSNMYFKSIILSQSSSLIINFLDTKIPFKILKNQSSINFMSDYKKVIKNNYLE